MKRLYFHIFLISDTVKIENDQVEVNGKLLPVGAYFYFTYTGF